MLIYDILDKNKSKIKFMGSSEQNVDVAVRLITELKKHNVKLNELEDIVEKENDKYLKVKLQDVITIYKEFQDRIEKKYIDENDILTILAEKIEETKMFENAVIYIDEFVGFTPQEYKIVEKLAKCGKQVTISVCTDELYDKKLPEEDVFYTNKKTVEKLINLPNVEIEKAVYLDKKYRFKSPELAHLEENIYENIYEKYNEDVKDIKLFLAKNQYSEIENVANTIIQLVRDEKFKFSDIAIITKDIGVYSGLVRAIFKQYNIPVFIDENADLGQNILVKYVLAILDIYAKNWSYEAVFNYIKSGFCEISKEEQFKLENYCIRYGIKGKKWLLDEWKFVSESEDAQMNILREKIVTPLSNLYNSLKNKRNVEEITKALYTFLIEMEIDKKLELKRAELEQNSELELANLYATSWNIFMELLDEIVLAFGDKDVTFEKYSNLLKIGLNESKLGKIPPSGDQVTLGDVDRSRSHKVKAIFIIGLNDGSFPAIRKEEGFLDDNDREMLMDKGIELAKGTTEMLYEDNFNIYKALTIAEEKLYLSYASADSESKALRPSILISKIKKIFPKITEESDVIVKKESIENIETTFEEMLLMLGKAKEGKQINDIWYLLSNYYNSIPKWNEKLKASLKAIENKNATEKISEENINKMYGDTLRTSVSRLEQYRACPFSFYLKYGLNLKEKRVLQVESIDTGTFMHDVIDQFFREIKIRKLKLEEIELEDIEEIVEEIIDKKLKMPKNYIFTSTSKFKVLTRRLKRVIVKSMKYILQTLTNSDFEILGTEVEFKEGKNYSPIQFELEDGRKIEVIGKIDRIDYAKDDKNRYLRIIDYKSSIKNIDLNDVVGGIQLQLLTYLDAITTNEEDIPAGIFYFNLIDDILKVEKSLTEEQIEEKIKKEFKLKGYILADVKVVKMMDKSLEKGYSNMVPVFIDSKENLSESRSKILTKEQFIDLQKYVNLTIKQIGKEIFEGNINVNPYYSIKNKKTPCKYCKYHSICQFESKDGYRYIENLEKQLLLENIKEKNKEEACLQKD